MNNVRRFLAATTTTVPPSPTTQEAPDAPPWVVEKAASWTPQRSQSSSSSEPARDAFDGSSSSTLGPSANTAPLFSTPGASTSSTNLFNGSRLGRRSSPPPSPRPPSPPSPPLPTRSKSATARRPPPIARRPITAQSSPAQSPRSRGNSRQETPVAPVNTRDELLLMLLSSQAVLDSRDFEVLSAEEVEALKTEHAYLVKRIDGLTKKVQIETKMRDAAASLSKLSHRRTPSTSTFPKPSPSSVKSSASEQYDTASAKVDTAQRELLKATTRASHVQRRLLEHRAAVLAHTARSVESQDTNTTDSSVDSSAASGDGDLSPVSTAPTSTFSSSRGPKFEGAHLFSGHAAAKMPKLARPPPTNAAFAKLEKDLLVREEELFLLEGELETLRTKLASVEGDAAAKEDKIRTMDDEIISSKAELDGLRRQHEGSIVQLETRLNDRSRAVRALRGDSFIEHSDSWEVHFAALSSELNSLRTASVQEQSRHQAQNSIAAATELELVQGRTTLSDVARSLNIPLPPSSSTIPGLAGALAAHVASLQQRRMDDAAALESERARVETERVRAVDEARKANRDIDEARRERDELKNQLQNLPPLEDTRPPPPTFDASVPGALQAEHSRIIGLLQSVWGKLPSAEARAKLSARSTSSSLAPKSPKSPKTPPALGGTPGMPGSAPSLSELDVRALKSLLDSPAGSAAYPAAPLSQESFTPDAFVERVMALLTDDKALVERLIRMASGHELLKANAERARKLAQGSSQGLETYQKQVKTLEERNAALTIKNATLLDDTAQLQEAVEQTLEEKNELELEAANHARAIAEVEAAKATLEATNKALQTRISVLAAEASALASSPPQAPASPQKPDPEVARLETELTKVTKELKDAQDELTRILTAESLQRIQLLDELNTLQQDNANLRNQLRAKS